MQKKVVIVTGASSGIGYAVASLAARKGYRVVLNARREDRLQALAADIKAQGGEASIVPGDIALLETQRRLVEETVSRYGRIDVLVNNAGLPLPGAFSMNEPEELRRQWDVNVTTLATLTRIALPHLEATRGVVVNIGSSISRFPVPGMGNYAPTKIAVAALSGALRMELARKGVAVCLVEPGPIATEFSERSGGGADVPSSLYVSAPAAAVPIVRLFKQPQRRIVIPGWLGPILLIAGSLTRLAAPLVEEVLLAISRRKR
ncbi:MAG: SDR family NAD(P)-dependent oxidoreductase [Chloroflexota bacterium]|nr:SDR family NAD(P)-dependent oxidoreductase [Chloroflexota bacterium]